MTASTQRSTIVGPAGQIEIARDEPVGASVGTAVIAHPHPLFGGAMDNKVTHTLARAFVQCGFTALRFNLRGVGASSGVHDEGRGETTDLLAVIDTLAPTGPLALAGFSFGAFVVTRSLAALLPHRPLHSLVLVGTAAARFEVAQVPAQWNERALVVHGENDDTVPLAAALDWARPQVLPVTVVPGGGHFFHGQLPLLKALVMRHVRAVT